MGCNFITYIQSGQNDDKYFQNYYSGLSDYAIVAPVEFRGEEANILGHTTVPVFPHTSVYYLGLIEDLDAFALVTSLVYNSLETWPLFVTALSMAVSAGVVIWLSVSFSDNIE